MVSTWVMFGVMMETLFLEMDAIHNAVLREVIIVLEEAPHPRILVLKYVVMV